MMAIVGCLVLTFLLVRNVLGGEAPTFSPTTFRSSILWTPYSLAYKPVHRWKFDESTTAQIAVDTGVASLPVDATLHGSAAFVGPGEASGVTLANDLGQDSYISLGDAFQFVATEGFSFAAHVQINSRQRFGKVFSLWDARGKNEIYLEMYDDTRQAVLSVQNEGVIGQLFTKYDFFSPIGEWAHVAATVSAEGDMKLYLDGLTVESTQCAGSFPKICDGWTLNATDGGVALNQNATYDHAALGRQGKYPGIGRHYFDGTVRDVMFFSGVLTGDQIQRLITYTTCPRLNFGESPHTGKSCERMYKMSQGYYTCAFLHTSGYYCGGCPCLPEESYAAVFGGE